MIDVWSVLTFLPAALLLNLTPGADMAFCAGQGLRGGTAAAWAASAGISLGSMVHALLAGLGLAAILAAYPWTFEVIRWIGVAYLLWLAVTLLRKQTVSQTAAPQIGGVFRSAFVVNLTNPKVALFMLALVPQFISVEGGAVLAQFLVFGGVLSLGGLVINGLVGVCAGALHGRLERNARHASRITAAVFAGLALRLAWMERT